MNFEQLPYIFIDISQPGDKGNFLIRTSDDTSGTQITETRLTEKVSHFEYFYTARLLERTHESGTGASSGSEKDRQADLIRYGQRLYTDLFGSDKRFKRYLDRNAHLKNGAKLVLRMHNTASELWNIPWEYMHDGEQFLGLQSQYTILRFLNDIRLSREVPTNILPETLRMLFVISNPRNAPPLHVNAEISIIRNAIQKVGGAIVIDFVEQGTLENVRRALTSREYHALHYSGHGAVSAAGSFLIMEDARGMASPVYLNDLLPIVELAPQLRFIFLSACKTSNINESTASSGIASGLMKAVPAVLAMQFSIRDDRAARFAEAFYGSIGCGDSLERATHAARTTLNNTNAAVGDWGVPSLYLQHPNMRLINPSTTLKGLAPLEVSVPQSPAVQSPTGDGLDQLPLVDPFHGRREEQRVMRNFLAEGKPLIYVWGVGGIGESALVRHVLERPGTEMPIEKVVVQSAESAPRDIMIALGRLIAAHFPETTSQLKTLLSSPAECIAALSQIVQGSRLVFVLDGFDSQMKAQPDRHWDFISPELRALCIALSAAQWSITTVITSRFRWSRLLDMAGNERAEISLSGLLPEDIGFLYQDFKAVAQGKEEKLVALLNMIGGHPRTLTDILGQLKSKPTLLDAPNWAEILTKYWKRGFLDEVLSSLSETEREALDIMSIHKSSFKPEHAQNLLSLTALHESESLVTVWEALSLVQYVGTDKRETPWYVIPNYIRTAITTTIPQERRPSLHEKVALSIELSFYRTLYEGDETEMPTGQALLDTVLSGLDKLFKEADLQLIDFYMTLVYEWQNHYRKAGNIARANQISLALMMPFSMFGRHKEMLELADAILNATPGSNPSALWANYWKGVCKLRDKQFSEAQMIFSQVVQATARQVELLVLYARAIERQGEVLRSQGKVKDALNIWKNCLKTCASNNDRTGLARILYCLAETQYHANQHVECVNYLTQGLQLYQKGALSNEDMLIYGLLLIYRGHLYRHMLNDVEAIKHYTEAFRVAKRLGSGFIIALALEHAGHVYMLLHQYDLAARQLLGAIDIYEKAGSNENLTMALTKLAVVQDFRGNAKDALGHAERAHRLAQEYLPANIEQTNKLVHNLKRKAR